MANSIRDMYRRLRRSVAQRGVRNLLGNLWRRVTRRRGQGAVGSGGAEIGHGAIGHGLEMHPFDEQFGVETSGMISWRELETGHAHDLYTVNYYGVAPSLFHGAMERWQAAGLRFPLSAYTFVDLGSGKGRPVLLAAEMPFKACIGVELNPSLSEISRVNMQIWQTTGRARCTMEAICQDATEFVFPAGPCVIFLFNPFTAQVLKKVIRNVARVFADRPGELDIVYINSEFSAVLAAHAGFERLWEERLVMSQEDASADLAHQLAGAGETYGKSGGEMCSAWRWRGV